VPSFQAFGEFPERIDPFQTWTRLAQPIWLPRLKAMGEAGLRVFPNPDLRR